MTLDLLPHEARSIVFQKQVGVVNAITMTKKYGGEAGLHLCNKTLSVNPSLGTPCL
jgi:hypothetical protein